MGGNLPRPAAGRNRRVSENLSGDDVDALQALIASSSLSSIEYYEMAARRYEAPSEEDASDQGQLTIGVQQRRDDDSFGVRLNARIVVSVGEAEVSVAGEYALTDSSTLTPRALQLFASEVAVMTVFPYLREAMASLTGRVFHQPLHLPMVSRGEIAVELIEPEA